MLKFHLISLAAAVLLSSCSQENTASNEIKIVLDWVPNTNHTGLFAAQKLGLFDKAGLRVQIITPPEGSTTQLIGAGGAELGISFQETLAAYFAAPNPLPVTAVAAILQHNTTGLIANKSAQIEHFAALENHTYATWDDPIEQQILRYLIQKDGGDAAKVRMIPYGWDVRAALATLADAAWIYYGWDGVAMEYFGEQTNFLPIRELDAALDYYTPVLIANNKWLQNHPNQAKKALAAIAEGYAWAAAHAEQAGQLMCEVAPEMSCELMKKSQNYLSAQYIADADKWGKIDSRRWAAFYDFLYDHGVIERKIGAAGFSNEYLPAESGNKI